MPDKQEAFGRYLATILPKNCVVYLSGDLGAGKTTLVRGYLRGLGHEGPVKSPTYTLMEPYELEGWRCYHFDLYRLADPEELDYLGLRDLLMEQAVLLFEWPELGEGGIPDADLRIDIHHRSDKRELRFSSDTSLGAEILPEIERLIGTLG